LAVIHPALYSAGQCALGVIRERAEIRGQDQQVLSKWTSSFSSVSVIANRITLPYRNTQSRHNWYDILVMLGSYQDCNLQLPGLGISLDYGPGTVVGLSGMMLEHQVPKFKRDRVCYAYFMRDRVHEWAGIPGDTWMKLNHYE